MDQIRLAVLNAAHDGRATRRNFRRELDADLHEFHCPSGEVPPDLSYDGFVVTGSRASVYWDEPWIDELQSWAVRATDAGIPGLGVCFGHQLLADVLGGSVEGMDEYEIGYRTVEHDGENELLDGTSEEFTVFTSHSDRVVTAPPGATVFAENEYGIHGFRAGDSFGVQFHPEYDMQTARSVTTGKEGQLTDERIESVLAGIHEENYRAACEAKQLFENFVEFASERNRRALQTPE